MIVAPQSAGVRNAPDDPAEFKIASGRADGDLAERRRGHP
jgi:hypothetical protein